MNIADLARADDLTLAEIAQGIGAANATVVRRYRDGERIPRHELMAALVVFSEGRVTPNDIYGLTDLIEEMRAKRQARLDAEAKPAFGEAA